MSDRYPAAYNDPRFECVAGRSNPAVHAAEGDVLADLAIIEGRG